MCTKKVILSHKGNSYCSQVAIIQKTTNPTSFSNKMEFSVFQSDQQLTCVEASCCQLTYQLQEFGSKSVATFLVSRCFLPPLQLTTALQRKQDLQIVIQSK